MLTTSLRLCFQRKRVVHFKVLLHMSPTIVEYSPAVENLVHNFLKTSFRSKLSHACLAWIGHRSFLYSNRSLFLTVCSGMAPCHSQRCKLGYLDVFWSCERRSKPNFFKFVHNRWIRNNRYEEMRDSVTLSGPERNENSYQNDPVLCVCFYIPGNSYEMSSYYIIETEMICANILT